MKRSKFFHGCVIAVTCTGMMSAQLVQAAGITSARPATPAKAAATASIQDISLQDGGAFIGAVTNDQGAPAAHTPVAISRNGQVIAKTETDANGRFMVERLTGGVYEVSTPAGSGVYRLWAPRTAPPAAQTLAVVSPQTTVVRGQLGGHGALSWLANPWVLAGLVAAAIAIPLALDDDDAS